MSERAPQLGNNALPKESRFSHSNARFGSLVGAEWGLIFGIDEALKYISRQGSAEPSHLVMGSLIVLSNITQGAALGYLFGGYKSISDSILDKYYLGRGFLLELRSTKS